MSSGRDLTPPAPGNHYKEGRRWEHKHAKTIKLKTTNSKYLIPDCLVVIIQGSLACQTFRLAENSSLAC